MVLEVTRAEIKTGLYSSFLERLLILNDTGDNALIYREQPLLQIVGYDENSCELPETPELREFSAKLTQAWPQWM